MKTGLLFMVMAFILFTGCQKQSTEAKTSKVPENALWRAPNGYVIPYSERDNYKAYVSAALQEKLGKHYTSEDCTTPDIKCGLLCKETKKAGDCVKANDCAPCMGCPCTPVTNPYDPS